jgi:hypothetical protein
MVPSDSSVTSWKCRISASPAGVMIAAPFAPLSICARVTVCRRAAPELIEIRSCPTAFVAQGLAGTPGRGLAVSYESIRRWVLKFGPAIARRLRQRRPKPSPRWHLDGMAVRIAGEPMYLWRAVDDEGEVLDVLVQRRRDKPAARRLMRKLLRKQGFAPTQITTDGLRSYGAAFADLGRDCRKFRVWGRTMPLREPSYAATQTARDPG